MLQTYRVRQEFNLFQYERPDSIFACPLDGDNMSKWFAVIAGPEQTPWQNGVFVLSIEYPPAYPETHAKIKFETSVYHPNVYTDGRICLDIIQEKWNPIYTTDQILMQIRSLLAEPNPESPANQEAAQYYKYDRHSYEMKVRQCVSDSLSQPLPIELQNMVRKQEESDE